MERLGTSRQEQAGTPPMTGSPGRARSEAGATYSSSIRVVQRIAAAALLSPGVPDIDENETSRFDSVDRLRDFADMGFDHVPIVGTQH